jgi:hypothetical protein
MLMRVESTHHESTWHSKSAIRQLIGIRRRAARRSKALQHNKSLDRSGESLSFMVLPAISVVWIRAARSIPALETAWTLRHATGKNILPSGMPQPEGGLTTH